MMNQSSMAKWFRYEMTRLNSGIVTKKKALLELVGDEQSSTETRDGSVYLFSREALQALARELPDSLHTIKLPISFYISIDVRSSAYLADNPSLEVMKRLREVPRDAVLTDGMYWMSKLLVSDIMKRRPSVIQYIRY
jgi:uncharacterized protein (UPF0216 family)